MLYCDKSTTRNETGPHNRLDVRTQYPLTVHFGMEGLEKRDAVGRNVSG